MILLEYGTSSGCTETNTGMRVQKGIQIVLQERGLWPESGLPLECPKPMCTNFQGLVNCQSCITGRKCELCKQPISHSSPHCSRSRRCDACTERSNRSAYVPKKLCELCLAHRASRCGDREALPPRCSSQDCCARKLISFQLDFLEQKSAIEESTSRHARYWCEYSLEALRRRVPLALESVSNETILSIYKRCQHKMRLYKERYGEVSRGSESPSARAKSQETS
ncbi:hypothetical protein K3495_g14898 [Podosphaera aphanis]|nr:hypothetical protein K3495_g14898 [Podosphaera aphanis]